MRSYDLFVTHAWRFHADWNQFAQLMDSLPLIAWRNFSLPWHDPAMDANTEVGGKYIRHFLETQIIPAQAVILLSGVYRTKSARFWLDFELNFARSRGIPIVGVPPIDEEQVPDDVKQLCDVTCGWSGTEILATLDALRERAPSGAAL